MSHKDFAAPLSRARAFEMKQDQERDECRRLGHGDVRRPWWHADHGSARRQGAADDLQQVTRTGDCRLWPRGRRTGRPRGSRARRALALAAAAACLTAGAARADGDPASDTLLLQNVFFPYSAPTRATESALQTAVNDVYAHGDRVKVALVYDPTDLGSVGSLFGKPDAVDLCCNPASRFAMRQAVQGTMIE